NRSAPGNGPSQRPPHRRRARRDRFGEEQARPGQHLQPLAAGERGSVLVAIDARDDAVGLQLRLQRRVSDLQQLGGALAVPLVALERLAQEALLEREERRLQALTRLGLRLRAG